MKSLDIDNQTLVEECRSGDKEALSLLYTRFAPRMLHVIARYVSDRDSARDILHDGFIAAFTRLDTLREPDRIDLWLATIMKNLSLKHLQSQPVTALLDEIPDAVDERELDDMLDFATLESLIRRLPDGYQKVFRLAVLEGKSHKEISEILGIAPNSSSSQLFHAKISLRRLIRDYQMQTGLISLMLLIVSVGILLLSRPVGSLDTTDLISEDTPREILITLPKEPTSPGLETQTEKPSIAATAVKAPSISKASSISNQISETYEGSLSLTTAPDSVGNSTSHDNLGNMPERTNEEKIEEDASANFYDRLFADVPGTVSNEKGWTASISVDPGLFSFEGLGDNAVQDSHPSTSNPSNPPDNEGEDRPDPARIPGYAGKKAGDIENYLGTGYASRNHYLPISFAVTAEKCFSTWLGVESGLGYSYLHTDFERFSHNGTEVSTCHWHYLEIPLKVNLYAYTSSRLKLYCSLGGRLALPIYSYAVIPPGANCRSGRFHSEPVWSAGGSVGAAFRLSRKVDL
ncbi:MAG: sigma-70 family RNA polymerase sigma factor, partial [Muribaculaceae bacterium]|nr:sigma-70 family RNA polymerase sigma factor [Muribaculaceae bacterium]